MCGRRYSPAASFGLICSTLTIRLALFSCHSRDPYRSLAFCRRSGLTLRPSDGVPEDYSNRTTLSSLLRLLRKETEPRLTVLERFERELATEKATRLTNVEINSVFSPRLATSLTSAAHPIPLARSQYCNGLDNPTLQTTNRAVGTVGCACTHRTKLSSLRTSNDQETLVLCVG